MLVKTRAPKGYEVAPFGARILNSDFALPTGSVEVFVPSYQPKGVPESEEDGVTTVERSARRSGEDNQPLHGRCV